LHVYYLIEDIRRLGMRRLGENSLSSNNASSDNIIIQRAGIEHRGFVIDTGLDSKEHERESEAL
jgi:hypothetical protein